MDKDERRVAFSCSGFGDFYKDDGLASTSWKNKESGSVAVADCGAQVHDGGVLILPKTYHGVASD